MVHLVSSRYDKVAADGCFAVAQLSTAYNSSRVSLAKSSAIMQALLDVVDGKLSFNTLTTAALALRELTTMPEGQVTFVTCKPDGLRCLMRKCALLHTHAPQTETDYELMFFRRYWCVCVCVRSRWGTGW
jgi:hypothetical protein